VKVKPAVEPAVTAAAVKSIVAGEHAAAGLLITNDGAALMVTVPLPVAELQVVMALVITTL
jgi:hypothetical protein